MFSQYESEHSALVESTAENSRTENGASLVKDKVRVRTRGMAVSSPARKVVKYGLGPFFPTLRWRREPENRTEAPRAALICRPV